MEQAAGCALHHAPPCNDAATLVQLDEQKAQFMRLLVHELKAPAAGAKMLIDALRLNEAVSDSAVAGVIERISQRLGRMIALIKDLLELAQMKSGDPIGEVAAIDLREETELGCECYREQAERKGLALRVDLPNQPLRARFDMQGYQLVLSNLLSNAIKYTPQGSVTVSSRRQEGWAVLEVSDTGIGVPEAEVPRLFGEFFRASNAKASGIEGNGVGLAGVRSLVERFGGELTLDTRENEGSTFTVWLPGDHRSQDRHLLS
jgi:signal transduction histidine kinase